MTILENFFNKIKNKSVCFIGKGVSHDLMIKMFQSNGINTTVVSRANGHDYLDNIHKFDIIIRTPGMNFEHAKLTEARRKGCVVTSEMELFFDMCPCTTIGVTGSDGKTTTTTLIAELLKSAGKTVHLGGNIGSAMFPVLDTITEQDFAVIELSSFQLISMRQSPDIAVITNVTPNHLDVHVTMENYINAKRNIILHQNAFGKAIINSDCLQHFKKDIRGRLKIYDNGDTYKPAKLRGIHNVHNFNMAVTAVAEYINEENITDVAKNFAGVEHRIEFVREFKGVKYYNDSIATSPTRVLAALNAFNENLTVIMGGYDKKIPFEPMADTICRKVKNLILMGDTKEKIAKAVRNSKTFDENKLKISFAYDMKEAVDFAYELSDIGDVVLLSPACASFDMYRMFEERGRHFKQIVGELNY
ncbi:MAG: UDP-N-acetylmuramoyl-L-alanine--D-glutamate ligase [Ruminococcus sp.]|jgi:UDP-N-acetylmuramoylalanine--D-glutamate ligase|nr:UDP-N-acetylmuramoyl-L-alanine--D-glutamate ligase [Ruminococcus sp.]